MKCARAGKALPLFVGGDLDSSRSREISAHLTRCESCRAAEAALRKSREWLQSAPLPPIGESDFAAIRRGVWRRIEADGNAVGEDRRSVGGLALAGGVLAGALLAVLLLLRPHSRAVETSAARLPSPPAGPAAPDRPTAESLPEPIPRGAIRRVARARTRAPAPAARPGVVQIEFQTANPDVRIIWLVKSGGEVPAIAGRNQEVS